ncbi:MAG: hypothetical protein Q4G70_12320 [Pseudomonadota bacterium]|nr:hypothetical protein [Pseudomonadota bacterium]
MTPLRLVELPAPDHWVYRKTVQGRQALASRVRLPLRDRQIVLLCTGERSLATLTEVFGSGTAHDLYRLVHQGLVEVVQPKVWPEEEETVESEDFLLTLPPLEFATINPANQSAFGITATPDEDALLAAHAQAGVLLIVIGGDEAEHLLIENLDVEQESDVLAFLTRAIALAARAWGEDATLPWAERIARVLPRRTISRLVDCLVDEGRAAAVGAGLYERLLADSAFDDEAATLA